MRVKKRNLFLYLIKINGDQTSGSQDLKAFNAASRQLHIFKNKRVKQAISAKIN